MRILTLAAAAIALGSGIIAAIYWYRASSVNFTPFEEVRGNAMRLQESDVAWISSLIATGKKSGRLNRVAAVWTAVSILFGSISSVLGALTI